MTQSNGISKAIVWLGITYPENMVEDWRETCSDLLQGVPYAYCVHDKDSSGHDGDRKEHVHWILNFKDVKSGPTTRKHATDVLNLLSKPGLKCAPSCEACLNIEHSWKYLIHDTETARKAGKHLYSPSDRVTGNTFDIERYKVLSEETKLWMSQKICDYILTFQVKDMAELYASIVRDFDESYYQIFKANNALYDRLCRGMYNATQRMKKEVKAPTCAICGNPKVAGSYDTGEGLMWYCMDCQEIAYVIVSQTEGDGEEAENALREFRKKQWEDSKESAEKGRVKYTRKEVMEQMSFFER